MNKFSFFKSKNILTKIKNSIKYRFEKKIFLEQWFLIFNFEDSRGSEMLKKFHKIIPPKDRFWADPFIVYKNGKYYIFFEEFFIKQNKGHISYFTIDKNGSYSIPTKILEQPFHLSYPFVFEYENEMYMIPETSEKKAIQLYKCLKFPEKWEFQKNIFTNIDAVDSTIFYHKNKWWMFTAIRKNEKDGWNNLNIFYADDPTIDSWISHPMNPITNNIENLRPAGSIFVENNQIYRPAQISSAKEYGKAIAINKINILDEKNYKEEIIKKVEPWEEKIKGIHTLNHKNGLTIFDSKWKIRKY